MRAGKENRVEEQAGHVECREETSSRVANTAPIQCRFSSTATIHGADADSEQHGATTAQNHTGMPDRLMRGLENLSGFDLSSVRVHYNSLKPRQLGALAYAQGTNIHLGPGQERHLPHEGWHVVQQMQGRVRPTQQMKSGVGVNDDVYLEREADVMGERARGCLSLVAGLNANSVFEPTIQMVRYQAREANPYTGHIDLASAADNISYAGELVKKEDAAAVAATGSVMVEEYSFPPHRAGLPVRSSVANTPVHALRVHNLSASPQRVGLGQLLTYHHARAAQERGLQYVIAMNVTDARGPFYERMGFRDYNPNPEEAYRYMEQQKQGLDEFLRRPELLDAQSPMHMETEDYMAFVLEKNRLTEKMAESPMIIDADRLEDTSRQRWSVYWDEQ